MLVVPGLGVENKELDELELDFEELEVSVVEMVVDVEN